MYIFLFVDLPKIVKYFERNKIVWEDWTKKAPTDEVGALENLSGRINFLVHRSPLRPFCIQLLWSIVYRLV